MKILILILFSTSLVAQDYNEYGEKFFDRCDKDIIAVEHEESLYDGYTTYSLYFPTLPDLNQILSISEDVNLLYLEFSFYKVTVVILEKNKRKVKKVLKDYAWKISHTKKIEYERT